MTAAVMPAPRLRRATALLAIFALSVLLPILPGPAPASAQEVAGSSAATVSGTGRFSGLQVTVGQTRNLINQVVEVSWKGVAPTTPGGGLFATDYLQVMQCWGDDPTGPSREQCQYGGLDGDQRGGQFTASRQLRYNSVTDPAETFTVDIANPDAFVPFRSVTGKTGVGRNLEFFDRNTSNELPFGLTRSNGTGLERFELQTAREAPGLGCGSPQTAAGVTTGRSCWLVVVPRDRLEVDGSVRAAGANQLQSSPLSATNWAQRLVVPLKFEPLGDVCPIGAAERPTVGVEVVGEAVNRWQPALCRDGGAVFGFSQVPDRTAHRQLQTDAPGLAFVTRPLPAGLRPEAEPVYAPVAASGIAVAFNIDSKGRGDASPEVLARDGERLSSLRLTPRLLAKLLTQSYRLGVSSEAPQVMANPLDMTRDKDFLAVNPDFAPLSFPNISDVLVPAGVSDSNRQVWQYVASDPEARAFLEGVPDPYGMTVNPNYKGLVLDREDFPKSDPFCREIPNQPPLCTLDAHPYAADMRDSARAAGRGDALTRTNYDVLATPPAYRKNSPQPNGRRYLLALTDTASAARYGLPSAQLRTADGQFTAPTSASLLAAVEAATPVGKTTVLAYPSSGTAPGAYPLTAVTYAATYPTALAPAARADYADLIDYVVGEGQQPGLLAGDLPAGYAPLPQRLRLQAARVSAALRAVPAAPAPVVLDAATPTSQLLPGGGSFGSIPSNPTSIAGGSSSPFGPQVLETSPGEVPLTALGPAPVPAPGAPPTTLAAVGLTPRDAMTGARYVPVVALLLGLVALATSGVLRRVYRQESPSPRPPAHP